ncbi:hypothetical protein HNP32_002353 [Brevundimonas bullata]|uniref:Uncharacterized protein n=1 Tax=Brevundimonas bullata TaxID=13160 RepID=A0A7W7IQC3_9CAUL|nr:hypothetical protein [Brevundimonas bullata]MBB6383076.1 hypothetical protein [Brevundimonas bullata]
MKALLRMTISVTLKVNIAAILLGVAAIIKALH